MLLYTARYNVKLTLSTFEKIMTPYNRLFYLALPPSVFKPVTTMLKVRKDNADKNTLKQAND